MKLKKKNLLVERGKPHMIRHAPNEAHNEVTVALIDYALPIREFSMILTPELLRELEKLSTSFRGTGFRFNYNVEAPAFLFSCKGKTERRGTDAPNQDLADKIAIAKARVKAYTICTRVMRILLNHLLKEISLVEAMGDFFSYRKGKEITFINLS